MEICVRDSTDTCKDAANCVHKRRAATETGGIATNLCKQVHSCYDGTVNHLVVVSMNCPCLRNICTVKSDTQQVRKFLFVTRKAYRIISHKRGFLPVPKRIALH